jgi:hypothetical protein
VDATLRLKKSVRSDPQILAVKNAARLVAIWVAVAPVPVMVLISMFLPLVRDISLVAFVLICPVGAVLVIIPVVVIMVPRVVDTDLDMLIVRHCSGDS